MRSILKKLRSRKKLVIILLVVGVIGFFILRSRNGNGGIKEATIGRGVVEEQIVLTGEIKATEYATMQFNSSGTLSWIGVKIGDEVKKGQALMKLDTLKLNAAYQVALANLRAAEANVDEVHDDVKGNDKDETFEEKNTRTAAETAKDKAYEVFISAQKDLRDATLAAPFNGVVALLYSESAGVNITATTPQIVIVNPETIYFEVVADQTEVSRFEVGQKAEILLDAFDSETVIGKITSISLAPDIAESGTSYPIRLFLETNSGSFKYKIGMTGDARFVVSRKEDVFYVPSGFLKSDKDGSYVLVGSGKDKKYVKSGIEGDDTVEINGDIFEGEKIFD